MTISGIRQWLCIFLLVMLASGAWTSAQAASLFEGSSVLEWELAGQIHALVTNREDRREYPMVLRQAGAEFHVAVRVRGKSRLQVCDFPPLRLNLGEDIAGEMALAGQDKLKLVTHCGPRAASELNVLEEYLAYRIFNLLTPAGYRVRLLHLTYTDTDGRLDPDARERYGFVIEPAEQLARRLAAEELQIGQVDLRKLNPDHAALVYVFQYLIGNTDWSLVTADGEEHCCHNGDLFKFGGKIHYVPFDFDLAGIVNASYARPDPELDLRSVRQRRYRGFCTEEEILLGAIRRVKSQRNAIEATIADTPGLTAKEVQNTTGYLESFFKRAGNEEKMLKSFARQCLDP